MKSNFHLGFTIIDLLVSISIVVLTLGFVLANFRSGQSQKELEMGLRQAVESITTVRNYSLAGKTNPDKITYPLYGYGVNFTSDPDVIIYRQFRLEQEIEFNKSSYAAEMLLPNGEQRLKGLSLIKICGFKGLNVNVLPNPEDETSCAPAGNEDWSDISWGNGVDVFLEVSFALPQHITFNYFNYNDADQYQYVGGIIKHLKTGRKAYFYVSLKSGQIASGIYE
jgi:hypothetical protein